MRSLRASRAHAWLLLVALIGGGLGLPLLDALVFHSRPVRAVTRDDSLSRTSPRTSHSQICSLDRATRSGSDAIPSPRALTSPGPRTAAPALPPAQFHPDQNWLATIQSRAPPALLS